MRVIPPASLHPSEDLAAVVGFMGAPTVSHEQLPSGQECLFAINVIEAHLSKTITAVFSGEIGGANGLRNLLVGAIKGVPCVDCDNMGRAFPRLDQKLPFILRQPVTPTCMCDVRGRTMLYTAEMIKDARELEDVLRKECIKMGLRGGLCMPPMTGEQVQHYTVHHSLSRAWFLGELIALLHVADILLALRRSEVPASSGRSSSRGRGGPRSCSHFQREGHRRGTLHQHGLRTRPRDRRNPARKSADRGLSERKLNRSIQRR